MKLSSVLLTVLSLSLAGPAALAQENENFSGAQNAEFEKFGCHLQICVGNTVQITAGPFRGRIGTVQALDPYRDTVTIHTGTDTLLARFRDVRVLNTPVNPRCYWNLCVGDSVEITMGPGFGQLGRVESLHPQRATVGVITHLNQRFFPNISQVRKVTAQPNCYAGICIGHRVQAISGRYRGHRGTVVAIQAANGVLSVRAPNGIVGFPTAFEVRRF